MQVSVDPAGLSAASVQVGRAGEAFATMSQAVRSSSAAASAAAGTAHAESGLSGFGEHWSTFLRVLAAAGDAVQQQLDAAAGRYAEVDAEVARAARLHR